MTKAVTFSLEALNKIVADAVAAALADKQAANKPAMNAAKSERSIKNEIATVKAFKKAGFGNVTPHKDVMTFNRWAAKGFRPMEGSKSLKVKNLRLFHVSQVRELTIEEKTKMQEQSDAAVARYMSQSIDSTEGEDNITHLVTQ